MSADYGSLGYTPGGSDPWGLFGPGESPPGYGPEDESTSWMPSEADLTRQGFWGGLKDAWNLPASNSTWVRGPGAALAFYGSGGNPLAAKAGWDIIGGATGKAINIINYLGSLSGGGGGYGSGGNSATALSGGSASPTPGTSAEGGSADIQTAIQAISTANIPDEEKQALYQYLTSGGTATTKEDTTGAAGTTALSGLSGGSSSAGVGGNIEKATEAQVSSGNKAIDVIMQMYNDQVKRTQPWYETGLNALGMLNKITSGGNIDASKIPGYDFLREQGGQAVERSAAARGGLVSGRTGKELTRFGTGLAETQYNALLQPLFQMAGMGTTATAQTAPTGTSLAIGDILQNQGTARASGYLSAEQNKYDSQANIMKWLSTAASTYGVGSSQGWW